MWEQKKEPKSISTFPPGSVERSLLPMIINPDLCSAVYSSSMFCGFHVIPLSLPLSIFFLTYTVPVGSKICPTHQGEGRAKSPPSQRMLITCVLSQAEPGLPLWIKGGIVSCTLIFHRPEMFGCSLSSSFCAREIIQAHSKQQNPSLSACWTTSPWLLWGHRCPD